MSANEETIRDAINQLCRAINLLDKAAAALQDCDSDCMDDMDDLVDDLHTASGDADDILNKLYELEKQIVS